MNMATAPHAQKELYAPLPMTDSTLLSDDFIAAYAERQPEWGPLGKVVYLRTYSRYLPELKRRERWHETCRRVVEHSLSLDAVTAPDNKRSEAEALFDAIWNLRAFPSGRGLWVAGTEHSRTSAMALFNCAYTNITSLADFHDMVILLMNGAGVGFGVRPEQVDEFRRQGHFTATARVEVQPYRYFGRPGTIEDTQVVDLGDRLHIDVGDSREGWAQFVREFLFAYLFKGQEEIRINLNAVRPKGTALKTFGGFASGPEPLIDFIQGIQKVFSGAGEITSVALLDTANLIGRMVVAGGTRRSAQIGLGSPYDRSYTSAKTGDWWKDFGWRSQSNNSVVFDAKPSTETLTALLEQVIEYGEPGFINGEAARKRRNDWAGLNPCAEILLPDGGFCNLTTVNLGYYAGKALDVECVLSDARLVTRHNLRITNVTMTGVQDKWDANQKADRLLGVSFTGYGDFVDYAGEEMGLNILRLMRTTVRQAADEYAVELDFPRPRLATTVKPEGSISQLPGVSSGIHDAYAPYYLRRVRISDSDAVAQALDMLGVPGEADAFAPNTRVYTFPVKTHAKMIAAEKPAVEQLGRYFEIMSAYVEHNASNTISFSREEIPEIVELLLERWDEYVAVSFLPKAPGSYPQMPYEAITAEQYEAAASEVPNLDRLEEYIQLIEEVGAQASDDLGSDCTSGGCPIR